MWDERFEKILRQYLPLLPEAEPLGTDLALRDYGLDSMNTVELLAALEAAYGVRFSHDAMNLDNFAIPESIWRTLSLVIAADS
jgi:acyl carrier protein